MTRIPEKAVTALENAVEVLNEAELEQGLTPEQEKARNECAKVLQEEKQEIKDLWEHAKWSGQDGDKSRQLHIDYLARHNLAGQLDRENEGTNNFRLIIFKDSRFFGITELTDVTQEQAQQYLEAQHDLSPLPDLSLHQLGYVFEPKEKEKAQGTTQDTEKQAKDHPQQLHRANDNARIKELQEQQSKLKAHLDRLNDQASPGTLPLSTDPVHWAEYGVATPDQLGDYLDLQAYRNVYKSEVGINPPSATVEEAREYLEQHSDAGNSPEARAPYGPEGLFNADKIEITKGNAVTDAWLTGNIKGHNGCTFQAKVFDIGSKFGINDGRISRLSIHDQNDAAIIYDRGWGNKPATPEQQVLLEAVLEGFPDRPIAQAHADHINKQLASEKFRDDFKEAIKDHSKIPAPEQELPGAQRRKLFIGLKPDQKAAAREVAKNLKSAIDRDPDNGPYLQNYLQGQASNLAKLVNLTPGKAQNAIEYAFWDRNDCLLPGTYTRHLRAVQEAENKYKPQKLHRPAAVAEKSEAKETEKERNIDSKKDRDR